ncbi:MAG: hypothetical protein ACYDCQ_22930 [Dehalococcoidia bacterium]
MQSQQPVVTIRPVETVEEYRVCQELQRRAWGITEDGYIVPVATMISVQHAGGLVLGAFVSERGDGAPPASSPSIGGGGAGSERLAGFAFGYLGRVAGRWALYSQLAAVDESLRSLSLGGRLKQAQRAWAREQGLELVAWSFDPLQAGNANFNLHRLGAFCRTYHVNYFGERSDALNAGLDSDRLLAEWPVEATPDSWRDDGDEPLDFIRIEIPAEIVAMRERDAALARAWQTAVREAFGRAFAAGYVAVDFERQGEGAERRAFYVLRRLPGITELRGVQS